MSYRASSSFRLLHPVKKAEPLKVISTMTPEILGSRFVKGINLQKTTIRTKEGGESL
jgi:hypothetical protein